MTEASSTRGEHVTDIEIARYLDRRLPAEQRDRIENHLAACVECRQHVLETQQLLGRVRRPRRLVAGGALAAAAAAVVLLITHVGQTSRLTTAEMPLRGGESAATLTAYGPIGEVGRQSLRFVWGAAPKVASYRVSLTSIDGVQMWTQSGADTVAIIPRTVNLRTGERYLWVADAILTDGTIRSTGLREFSLVQ